MVRVWSSGNPVYSVLCLSPGIERVSDQSAGTSEGSVDTMGQSGSLSSGTDQSEREHSDRDHSDRDECFNTRQRDRKSNINAQLTEDDTPHLHRERGERSEVSR